MFLLDWFGFGWGWILPWDLMFNLAANNLNETGKLQTF